MTSVMDSPTAADQSVELPNELKIPLPASSSCSEDEGDSQKRISVDHPVQDHGSISTSATEKYKEESHPLSSTPPKGESTAEIVNPITSKTPPFSLDELARLIGLEQHENCRWHSIRKSVEDLSFAFALDRRLIRSSSVAFRILIERFRANDHAGFATAYQTSQSLADSCNTTGQPVQISGQHGENNERNAETFDEPSYSWLQRLSPGHRKGILDLVLKIRTEPTFMAEHISSLPPSDFAALTTSYQRFNLGDSVFQNHSHGKVRQVPKDSNFTASVDSIRSFNRNDPYFLLLYGLFDDSSKLGTHEYSLRADMWSTVCAKILEDGKRGSDEFAITTMDAFSGFQEWKLKSKMEMFLMKILHEGAFLLDPPQPADFKQPVEIQNAQAAVAVAHFFDKSLKNLFELLTNGPIQKSVPETALNFAHAVLSKIKEPRIRLRTKTLITSRWYFTSFISTILVYPEVS